jgi:signal transduction histidine kinase
MAEVTAHLEGRKPLFEVEHRMVCKDGGIRWYLARGSAFHDLDGKPYRVVGTDTDITERREMEAALQRAHDGLEGQVAERTAELAAANRKLEQEIQQRHRMEHELVQTQRLRAMSEMSRGISHNLNNILMGISGPAALLHQDAGESEQAEWSQMILDSIQRATDIVARLDSALRIATSEVVGSVDANAVIRDTLEASMPLWRDEAHVRGIDIHVDTDLQEVPDIRGTDSALADVVMNLLLNAVDAMPEGGRIQVASARFDDAVRVSVCDTGIGMDEATTRRVFEPLFTTNHDVGRGLGLSVAYGTVTRWGGSIGIESRPREGTTVTVDLPIWVEDSDATSLDGPRDTGQRRKVLVVDDEEAIVRTLGRWLGRDHDVQTALNGQQALQGFDEGIFDAALVDLGMAGQRGDWVAREMKERDPAIVTVLMTGWRLREDDPRLHSFDLRIDKPIVRLAELQKVLDQAFALHDERVASP